MLSQSSTVTGPHEFTRHDQIEESAPPFPVSTHQKGIALLTWPLSLTGYPSILQHISYNSHHVSEGDSILLSSLSAAAATENRGGPADHLEIKLATSSDRSRIGMYGSSGRRAKVGAKAGVKTERGSITYRGDDGAAET